MTKRDENDYELEMCRKKGPMDEEFLYGSKENERDTGKMCAGSSGGMRVLRFNYDEADIKK